MNTHAIPRAPRRERGFSLIELCFAMLLALVVSAGTASAALYAVRFNRGAAVRSLAVTELRRQAEFLHSTPYGDLEAAVEEAGGASRQAVLDGKTFAVETSFEYSPPAPAAPLTKTITVTVTPLGGQTAWANTALSVTLLRSILAVGPHRKK